MDPLPKIPSPPALLWREIRHSLFPPLIFSVALGAAVILWRDHAAAPKLVGEVELVVTPVTTVEDGLLTSLKVDRFQTVVQGDVIAELRVADPDSVRLELAPVAAELQMLETRLQQDQQRILQDYEQLRLSWLRERVALATARVELHFAKSELNRIGKLAAEKLVSTDQLELAQSVVDSRGAEVEERSKLVDEIAASLGRLAPADPGEFGATVAGRISQALAAQEELLSNAGRKVTLRAPISGRVTALFHRENERIRRGEPLVAIASTTPERIIGYLRAPVDRTPQPGDVVEVRSRANRRQIGLARILQVGGHFETITTNLVSSDFQPAAKGLPILISLPENLPLLPGESVDLAFRRH
ncbi:MAG TPA: hypothetical protein DCY13_16695 [Verrucomicrobiales bacterium]|nr:hypothetical protein [Verrucomicrobiales bacterium]